MRAAASEADWTVARIPRRYGLQSQKSRTVFAVVGRNGEQVCKDRHLDADLKAAHYDGHKNLEYEALK